MVVLLVMLVTGCRHTEEPEVQRKHAVSFAMSGERQRAGMPYGQGGESGHAGMPAAHRAPMAGPEEVGAETLFDQFIVYGYKNPTVTTADSVMQGFRVNYVENTAYSTTSNTHDWEYVGNTADYTSLLGDYQTIRYWDGHALSYRFFAVGGEGVKGVDPGFTTKHTEIDDVRYMDVTLPISAGAVSGGSASTGVYYSHLEVVSPTAYTQPVKMRFLCPLAKVRIGFIFGELVADYVLPLTNITFAPADESEIAGGGDITVRYPLTGERAEDLVEHVLVGSSTGPLATDYADVTETSTDECQPAHVPTDGYQHRFINTTQYYVLPQEGTEFKLSVTYADAEHEVIVSAAKMAWESNKTYTYVFKILDPQHIVMVDAEVKDWLFGGEVESEESHW